MLNVGENVFIPNYGAGVVKNIMEKSMFDKIRNYVYIELVLDSMTLHIPENKVKDYRIRSVCSKENIYEEINMIGEKPNRMQPKWSVRYRENNDKISDGDLRRECEVLRDLYYLKVKNILPPGERKILERVEELVGSEVSLVFRMSLNESIDLLRSKAIK